MRFSVYYVLEFYGPSYLRKKETTYKTIHIHTFANKGIDALNFSNILNQKSVQSNIPPYFQNKESPCISYSYTRSVASKIFNYKRSLQQIDFNSLSQNPLPCTCPGSEFLYAPCGHVVSGDLSIVQNDKLRDLLRKGPKFREPVSFSWHQNFDIIMDACEAYARQCSTSS